MHLLYIRVYLFGVSHGFFLSVLPLVWGKMKNCKVRMAFLLLKFKSFINKEIFLQYFYFFNINSYFCIAL